MREGLYQVVSTIEIPFFEADTYTTHEFRPPVLGTLNIGDTFTVLRSSNEGDGFVRALILVGTGIAAFMAAIKIGEGVTLVAFHRKTAPTQTAVSYA